MHIRKSSGEKFPYSRDKLKNSLLKAGADEETIQLILDTVESELYEGISSRQIYKEAFRLLKRTRMLRRQNMG